MAPSRVTRSAASVIRSTPPPDHGEQDPAADDGELSVPTRVLRTRPEPADGLERHKTPQPKAVKRENGSAVKPTPRLVGRQSSRRNAEVEPPTKRLRRSRDEDAENVAEVAELEDESDEESDGGDSQQQVPKIRLKFALAKPIVAQPAHMPLPATFNSLDSYLDSFRSMDDDVPEDVFSKRIQDEAKLRQDIEDAKVSEMDPSQGVPQNTLKKPFDVPRQYTHGDYLLSHVVYLSKLASDERRSHISRAKKIASMIQQRFKRLSGVDEKERKLEERRMRQLAKRTANEVKRKWRLAEKVVRQKINERVQEQQRQAGKEQLNSILDQSTQLLQARKDHHHMKTEDNDDNPIFDESDSDVIMDSELDSTSDDEDSDDDIASLVSDSQSEVNELEDPNKMHVDRESVGAKAPLIEDITQHAVADAADNQDSVKDEAERDLKSAESQQATESEKSREVSLAPSVGDRRLDNLDSVSAPKTAVPFLLRGTLREYQHSGLDWLVGLYNSGTNGILADEMGLGKTIQTISLLSYLACEKEIWGPHLIIVPTSVMLNWEMEFKRFAPGFRILTYYGSPSQRKEKRRGWNSDDAWDVCITSYQLVIHDQTAFRRKQWQYMILDEAHNIKNFRSQRWQALLNFKAKRRLLLTGTPLQNNLVELWSLLYFLMPSSKGTSSGMANGFASLADFQEWFSHPVDKLIEGNFADSEARNTIAKLHKVLRPYLLRRLKADVEKQMPAKYEHIVYCKLSKRQRYLYDDFMSRAQTRETLASGNFLSIINCLMQLRKVCNHPDLFEVRPIVTSFAMPKSVVASYEINELLVRRRLLAESDSRVSLEFLNLVPTRNECMATGESESLRALCANAAIRKDLAALEPLIEPDQPIDFSSVSGYRRTVARRQKFVELATVTHRLYTNTMRCHRPVIYGRNVVAACRVSVPRGEREPWLQTYPSDKFTASVVERSESMKSAIEHYACVTPAVVALDLPQLVFAGVPAPVFAEISERYENPMHQAQVKMSIAFPDKRLLQYDCGKLQRLATLLRDLTAGGHRALIFTQMTRVLDILEQFLNIHGYRYMRLDGATKIEQRQVMTERFNTDPKVSVFILSTRSGGLGINLTGADTVIFYDSDWNPSMDKQCQDRCHRIGQTRDVHIYRFVSEHTIESNILRKANQKRLLDDLVIQEGDFTTDYFTKLSLSDMLGTEGDEKTNIRLDQQVKGVGLEKALAQAEDEDDANAATVAMGETQVDEEDFVEQERAHEPDTSTPQTPARAELTPGTDKGGQETMADQEDEEEDEDVGSVDDYMIRFIEQGHYWD